MEAFSVDSPEESRRVAEDPDRLAAVGDEWPTCFATPGHDQRAWPGPFDGDLPQDREERLKYPVEEYRGRYGPEDRST